MLRQPLKRREGAKPPNNVRAMRACIFDIKASHAPPVLDGAFLINQVVRYIPVPFDTIQADVAKLRLSAAARDVDQNQFLLKKIYRQTEFVIALGITAEQAYTYADTFESYHPEEIWARRMLLQIVMTASAPDESIIQQAFQHFTTPGTANFFKTLYDLYQSTQKKYQSEPRIGFLVSATVNAITAELVEMYFRDKLDTWEAYRSQGQDFEKIALAFWTDEAVIERDKALWLAVADRIENHVTRYQKGETQS